MLLAETTASKPLGRKKPVIFSMTSFGCSLTMSTCIVWKPLTCLSHASSAVSHMPHLHHHPWPVCDHTSCCFLPVPLYWFLEAWKKNPKQTRIFKDTSAALYDTLTWGRWRDWRTLVWPHNHGILWAGRNPQLTLRAEVWLDELPEPLPSQTVP